jgi:hypothetical protein
LVRRDVRRGGGDRVRLDWTIELKFGEDVSCFWRRFYSGGIRAGGI